MNGPADLVNIIVLSCKDMLRSKESKLNHSKREREGELKNFPLHFMSCWDTDFCLLEEWEWF